MGWWKEDQIGHLKMRFQNLLFGLLNQHFLVSLSTSGPHSSLSKLSGQDQTVSKVPISSKIRLNSNSEVSWKTSVYCPQFEGPISKINDCCCCF